MQSHHKDDKFDAALKELTEFMVNIETTKQVMKEEIWKSLGGWNDALLNVGTHTDFEKYIDQKLGTAWEVLEQKATAEMMYCYGRINGSITDEFNSQPKEAIEAFKSTKFWT